MAQLLTDFVRRFMHDPQAARASLTVPLIVWQAPPRDSTDSGSWQLTQSGSARGLMRPNPGETLVYPVEKAPMTGGLVSPFPMGITLGRVDSNDLVLDDSSVSRFHAWLQFEERTHTWWLTDAESRNGTWVSGMKCEPRKRVALHDGSEIKLGDAQLQFFFPDSFVTFARTKMA